jgi:hypothetical protein
MKNKLISILTLSVFSLSTLSAQAINVTLDKQETEVKQQVEQIKQLPKDQRKQKMDDLKTKYPDFFNKHNNFNKKDYKNKENKKLHSNLDELIKKYPQLESEINQIKDLPKNDRREKMKALKEKYPDIFKKMSGNNKAIQLHELSKTNTELANELNQLKNLSKKARKSKMKELQDKYLNK